MIIESRKLIKQDENLDARFNRDIPPTLPTFMESQTMTQTSLPIYTGGLHSITLEVLGM
jgi:hypothetical protein